MPVGSANEGLGLARAFLTLSSLSPLFLLWAVAGNFPASASIPLTAACIGLALVSNGFLWMRMRAAKRYRERRELVVGHVEDARDHFLVYLVPILLPLYAGTATSWRALVATGLAFVLIWYVFWTLNLHYVNVWFLLRAYRIYVIHAPRDPDTPYGMERWMLISKRRDVPEGVRLWG